MMMTMFHAVLMLLAPAMLLLCGKKKNEPAKPKPLSGEDVSKVKSVNRSGQAETRPASAMAKSGPESVPNTPATETPADKPKSAPPTKAATNVPKTAANPGASRMAPSGQGQPDDGGYENLPEMTPEEMAAIDKNGMV